MRIKKVKLYNFSSYAGENEIDLTTSQQQRVVLIGGNNGAGKTSLFTAVKLALYGPQCFRFQDKNNQYTAKIKDLINHDAYVNEDVKAFVELEITLPGEREVTDYTLRREWGYAGQRLKEEYRVWQNGEPLSAKDQDFFQNYLFSIIPPNLFDFFFFDGEEIADFFAAGNYNGYIKNAVLTLCGYDTFSIIKRFCDSYVGAEKDNAEYEHTAKLVEEAEQDLAALENRIEYLEMEIPRMRADLEACQSEKNALEIQFKKSGGLSDEVRAGLQSELDRQERAKGDSSKKMREFVETMMPVFITRELAQTAYAQMENERAVRQYQAVMQELSVDTLQDIMKGLPGGLFADGPSAAKALSAQIGERLKPNVDLSSFQNIHDLSQEQENQITSIMVQLQNFDTQKMIAVCRDKETAGQKYDVLAKKLRESLPDVDANTYLSKVAELAEKIERGRAALEARETELKDSEEVRSSQKKLCDRLRKTLQAQARNQTAYVYTERVSKMMQALIQGATREKFKQLESLTLQMFQKIIRKDNFVELIELDEEFNVNLYKKQAYTARELALLVQNIGMDELERRLGSTGVQKAIRHFSFRSKKELRAFLLKNLTSDQVNLMDEEAIPLYKHMELNQLSKGEKQVFVLALYWAIIKTSGQSVPFIIDTPFARIDTEHREQIAKLFFPDISEQVIILSTDEEVVGPYREALKSFISHEYRLDYVAKTGQTAVRAGYFDEVGA